MAFLETIKLNTRIETFDLEFTSTTIRVTMWKGERSIVDFQVAALQKHTNSI